MKNKTKLIVIVILISILIALIFIAIHNYKVKHHLIATAKGVVVRVYDNSLYMVGEEDHIGLCSVGFAKDGNIGFKQGQEILVYFDGMILTTAPASLGNVGKIKILKEESDIPIPESAMQYCYSSFENVDLTISEFTPNGMTHTIADKNELSYNYSNDKYEIRQKVKNPDYPSIGQQIGEDTGNSISGYTRNRNRIFMARTY